MPGELLCGRFVVRTSEVLKNAIFTNDFLMVGLF